MSGFAFQGTNAHVILSSRAAGSSSVGSGLLPSPESISRACVHLYKWARCMMVESACRPLQAQRRCQSGTGSISGSFHSPQACARALQGLEQALPLMWRLTGLHWRTSGSIRYALW